MCIVKGPKGWSLPGGKSEAGESSIEALFRELHEEIGIIAAYVKLIDFRAVYIHEGFRTYVWYGYIDGRGSSFKIPLSEIQAIKWIDYKDLILYSPYWRDYVLST
jgi:8-oxo-dGTP pyrophosphatase MutT (NUDIX family)